MPTPIPPPPCIPPAPRGALGAPGARRSIRAFSLFELTFVLLILGIVAAALVPAVGNNIRAPRLRAAANVLAADIEYCASLCISRPGDPAALLFNLPANRYSLIDLDSGNTLTHPMDGQDFLNDFASGRNAQLADIQITSALCAGTPATALTFDAYGKPVLTADLVITLTYKTQSLTLTVSAATGDVTIAG